MCDVEGALMAELVRQQDVDWHGVVDRVRARDRARKVHDVLIASLPCRVKLYVIEGDCGRRVWCDRMRDPGRLRHSNAGTQE